MSQFYDGGLHFSCTQCSNCCRHDPGYVFLSSADLHALSDYLGISCNTFESQYCVSVAMGGGFTLLSLKEDAHYDCVFWTEDGCAVYKARPKQCQTYPFWQTILEDLESWNREAQQCPGIGTGRLWTSEEIEELLRVRRCITPIMRRL